MIIWNVLCYELYFSVTCQIISKVATFNLDEDEPIETTSKDWDEIIPETDRLKMEEEDRINKEKELYLPPRQRTTVQVEYRIKENI